MVVNEGKQKDGIIEKGAKRVRESGKSREAEKREKAAVVW